jgi:hypothetical protein
MAITEYLEIFPTDLHVFDSMQPGTAVAQRASCVLEDWLETRLHLAGL